MNDTLTFEYPKRVGFVCQHCSKCCGDTEDTIRHILLLKTDADRISNKTSLDVHEFAEKISGSEPYIYEMEKTKEGKCLFLKNKQCTIYNNRPLICRFYPFQLKNLTNNRYAFSYTTKCPGIGKESALKPAFFENLFNEFATAMEQNALLTRYKKEHPDG